MRNFAWCALLATSFACAQNLIPLDAITAGKQLKSEARARYLMRQLELTEQQAQAAEGLIEVHFAASEDPQVDIEEIRRIWKELQAAQAKGDKETEQALTKRIQEMGKGTNPEPEFVENLTPVLVDPQPARLAEARERLDRNPSGALQPIDLVRVARGLTLSPEQSGQLGALVSSFRTEVNSKPAMDDGRKVELINGLATQIKKLLTPEQTDVFEKRVKAMRSDLADNKLRPGEKKGQKQESETSGAP